VAERKPKLALFGGRKPHGQALQEYVGDRADVLYYEDVPRSGFSVGHGALVFSNFFGHAVMSKVRKEAAAAGVGFTLLSTEFEKQAQVVDGAVKAATLLFEKEGASRGVKTDAAAPMAAKGKGAKELVPGLAAFGKDLLETHAWTAWVSQTQLTEWLRAGGGIGSVVDRHPGVKEALGRAAFHSLGGPTWNDEAEVWRELWKELRAEDSMSAISQRHAAITRLVADGYIAAETGNLLPLQGAADDYRRPGLKTAWMGKFTAESFGFAIHQKHLIAGRALAGVSPARGPGVYAPTAADKAAIQKRMEENACVEAPSALPPLPKGPASAVVQPPAPLFPGFQAAVSELADKPACAAAAPSPAQLNVRAPATAEIEELRAKVAQLEGGLEIAAEEQASLEGRIIGLSKLIGDADVRARTAEIMVGALGAKMESHGAWRANVSDKVVAYQLREDAAEARLADAEERLLLSHSRVNDLEARLAKSEARWEGFDMVLKGLKLLLG